MLRAIVTVGYLGWSAFSATALLVKNLADATVPPPKTVFIINALALSVLLAFFALLAKSPIFPFALNHDSEFYKVPEGKKSFMGRRWNSWEIDGFVWWLSRANSTVFRLF